MSDFVNRIVTLFFLLVSIGGSALFIGGCAAPGEVKPVEEVPELVWPAPPEQPRIKYIGSIRTVEDVTGSKRKSLRDILMGADSEEFTALVKPYGVHSDSQGRIYVSDTATSNLVVFDTEKKDVRYLGQTGPGTLKKPVGISTDDNGRVYVTDVLAQRVVIFDNDGEYITAFGGPEIFKTPAGIAINDSLEQIFVVDSKKHQILVFNLEGSLLHTIGEQGGAPGQFNIPTNISIDSQGRLYIADSMNFRVQVLDADGTVLKHFGKVGDRAGDFSRLKGIGVDGEGHIYAVDSAFNNFQIFDQDGNLLLFIGQLGAAPGQFYLPAGAHVDENNRIYIADQFNRRIQIFQYLGEPVTEPASSITDPDITSSTNH